MRYQLDVLATSVTDVVNCAGGWLFDRAMAGWDVTVLARDHHDIRPLQILGVQVMDLEAAMVGPPRSPAALGVATELYLTNELVRSGVRKVIRNPHLDVTLWGEVWPLELDRGLSSARHELSSAARIFKAHALLAAEAPTRAVGPVETFRTATPKHRLGADVGFAR